MAEEEEALEQARQNAAQQQEQDRLDALLMQQQTFVPDEANDYGGYRVIAVLDNDTNDESAIDARNKKSFVADDGARYKWDEEEQDWVVDDGDGDGDGDMEADEGNKEDDEESEGEYTAKKRHLDNSDDEDPDEFVSGQSAEGSATHLTEDPQKNKKKRKPRKKRHKGPNTWIYVDGLPADITIEEIKDHFSKVGLIAISPFDQQPRIKIYTEAEDSNICKGDCTLCYNAEESVQLAVDILNGGYIRPNYKINVTRATFNSNSGMKDETAQPQQQTKSSIPRRPSGLTQAQIKVAKNAMKQALAWNEDDDIGVSKTSALKIVVLEGMFKLSDFADPNFEEELQVDVATECEKFGPLDKLTLFSSNPRGIVVVKFKTAFAAQECIRVMNGRYFGGVKIKCYFWDGVTNYSIIATSDERAEELENQEESRLNEFGDWLEKEQEVLPEEFQLRTE